MRQLSRRKIAFLAALAAVVLLAVALGRTMGQPPVPVSRQGDESAAAFGDGPLLNHLQSLASRSDDAAEDVEGFFRRPDGDFADPYPFEFKLLSTENQSFHVVVYRHVDAVISVLPFAGDEYWGRACIQYAVSAHEVSTKSVTCEPGTPELPKGTGD
jgi:hypothetical protein